MILEIWLVVMLFTPADGPRKLLDERRPSIEACLSEAREILNANADSADEFELVAQCSIKTAKKDPA